MVVLVTTIATIVVLIPNSLVIGVIRKTSGLMVGRVVGIVGIVTIPAATSNHRNHRALSDCSDSPDSADSADCGGLLE